MFAELKDPVRRKIERYGLARTIEPRHFFPTVGAAVAAFRAQTGAQWTPAHPASADGTAPGQGVADNTRTAGPSSSTTWDRRGATPKSPH